MHCCSDVLTNMGKWKLWFVLLLLLIIYVEGQGSRQHLMKAIGKEPDVTPICNNATLNLITFIMCRIRTERNWEDECRLSYRHGQDFEHGCDSRFTLVTENQTVFLHLTSLTPEDSGICTCECSYKDGTNTLHLNITVEGDEISSSSTEKLFPYVVIGVITFTIVTGVILGFIYRKIRRRPEATTSHPDMEPGDIEPYSTFMQRENGLYSVVRIHSSNTNVNQMCLPEMTQI